MNQEKIALTLLGLAAELLGKNTCCSGLNKPAFTPEPCNCGCTAHTPRQQPRFNREPDGVQIVVDRPKAENYSSHHAWARDMANYRTLIDQAKKCEGIKTRKPDCVPQEVHDSRRDWYDDHGQGFNDIKRTVINAERRDMNPFARQPKGFCVEPCIVGVDPNCDWF